MTQKYTVPFYIDESLEDIIAEDESLTKEELLANIAQEGENHNVTVDIGHWLIGMRIGSFSLCIFA